MTKTTGLGQNLYYGGYDISNNVTAVSKISGTVAPIDVTTIQQLGHDRIGGLRDGSIDFTAVFDPVLGHPVFSLMPTTDVHLMYATPASGGVLAVGDPAACLVFKQPDYPATRTNAGEFTFALSGAGNGYGLEWCDMLTPGLRTDTTATTGATSLNHGASSAFGAQAYLQVMSVAGTSVTVAVQDSADGATGWANVSGLAFTAVTPAGAPAVQRLATANNATVKQYLRITTTGTFTSAVFAVAVHRNETAGTVF